MLELCKRHTISEEYHRALGQGACFLAVFPTGNANERPRFNYRHTGFVYKLISDMRQHSSSSRARIAAPVLHKWHENNPAGIDLMADEMSRFYTQTSNLSPHYDSYLHSSAWYIPGGEPVMQQLQAKLEEVSELAAYYFNQAVVFDVRGS